MTAPTPADVPGQGEVEGLAEIVDRWWELADQPTMRHDGVEYVASLSLARTILASDWLAKRDAGVARATIDAVLRRAQDGRGRGARPGRSGNEKHAAHVAAEVVKALGAETRVEWGVRDSAGHLSSYGSLRELAENRIANRRRVEILDHVKPWGLALVSRTVTTFRHEGDWTEVPSSEGDA